MEWLKRFPTLGQGEQFDQELRWSAARTYITHTERNPLRGLDWFVAEARECPLVPEAVWVVEASADIATCEEFTDKAAGIAANNARHKRINLGALFYACGAARVEEDEITILSRAGRRGHEEAALQYVGKMFGLIDSLQNMIKVDNDADRILEHQRGIVVMENAVLRMAPVVLRCFNTIPSCRGNYIYEFGHFSKIGEKFEALFAPITSRTTMTLIDAIAAGSIYAVISWVNLTMISRVIPIAVQHRVAVVLLRSLVILNRGRIEKLLTHLVLTAEYNPHLVSHFLDGINNPRNMVRDYPHPHKLRWNRVFDYRKECWTTTIAWTVCAKRMGIHKDMRIMIAKEVWDARHDIPKK